MRRFEDFMQEHKDEFDVYEPSPRVWNQIESAINPKRTLKRYLWAGGAVAAVLVVALLTTIVLNMNEQNTLELTRSLDPELVELIETEAFYASKVNSKLTEIRSCYYVFPELKSEIESDLAELDNLYKELQNDLNDNIYNREVIEAMIQNNRLKLELVDRVLKQINC
jgi:hypothetical protein